MFFPWPGLFEQVRLADTFVHYHDVQLPVGRSFMNRVQIKTKDGSTWLTVPLRRGSRGGRIDEARLAREVDWPGKHLRFLGANYARAPYRDDMLAIVDDVYAQGFEKLSDLNVYALEKIARFLGLSPEFRGSSEWPAAATGSRRLLEIVQALDGDFYITGMGALQYLDYDLFEEAGVRVEYMDYRKKPYRQGFGEFDPYVSVLDLIAWEGSSGSGYLVSDPVYWKDFKEADHGSR